MQEVWSLFKFLETCGGLSCIGFHCYGFLRKAIDFDHVLYSVIFFGGTIITMMSHLDICMGGFATSLSEALLHFTLGAAFMGMWLLTTYHAEDEYSVMFYQRLVSNRIVESFKFSKAQSIAALVTGLFHILHFTLACDAYVTQDPLQLDNIDDEDVTPNGPLKMYIVNSDVHNYLMQYDWFEYLRGKVTIKKKSSAYEK